MSNRFSRVLIANRGEIAVRIIRSVRGLGYESVAVFSDADADAPFVALADRAVPLGASEVSRSYLDADKVIAAARAAGADAVHPGYGLLSENADFAEKCRDAGLAFIGPRPDSIRTMGDKRLAKQRMLDAGVPCVPGHLGSGNDAETFLAEAESIGYPIIIKAASGGGGRGMRLVGSVEDLAPAVKAARSEAKNAFGDGAIYLEKLIERARHVEIQIIADEHGNIVHLGERDCSVQRRFQKVIEESPSPRVDEALREEMGQAALAAARAVDYVGVGTVEFLVDDDGRFYFIEMNTRLQVEHPVTEMVTGLDLVDLQLRVAAGEALPFSQDDVVLDGHAVEARFYAEDASNGYLPQTGRILSWRPTQMPGVRIDSGVAEGQEITSYYDAMVAKVIAHGRTRDEAIRRLANALRANPLLGVATNRRLLLDICHHPSFVAGDATTDFLEELVARPKPEPSAAIRAVAAMLHGWRREYDLARWLKAGRVEWSLLVGDAAVSVSRDRTGAVTADVDGEMVSLVPLQIEPPHLRCVVDGVAYRFTFARTDDVIEVDLEGEYLAVERRRLREDAEAATGMGTVLAPMSARVIRVEVRQNQSVARGDPLLVVEAMKMEMTMRAPRDGVVTKLHVGVGDQVSARQPVLVVDASEAEDE